MAQGQDEDGNDGANFVREIVTDPRNVPDVMLLYGYLGASSEEGHERLYLAPDLSNYVEVPTAAILHREPAPKERDPHGGVTLWVKKDAALQQKLAPAAQALAYYLAGAIQAGAAITPVAVQPPPAPTLLGYACGVPLRPTQQALCQTQHPIVCSAQCPTGPIGCPQAPVALAPQAAINPTQGACPTFNPIVCTGLCETALCGSILCPSLRCSGFCAGL